jgi:hypothetical protein
MDNARIFANEMCQHDILTLAAQAAAPIPSDDAIRPSPVMALEGVTQ